MDQTFMKKKPILPLVLAMSIPNVLSMLVNSLYNIVDSLFVAQISENAMTALSLVFPIQNIMIAVSVGFGIGVNAMIAYFMGTKDQEKANFTATMGVFLSIIHGIIMMAVFFLAAPAFLGSFTTDEEILSMSIEYSFTIFIFMCPYTVSISMEKIYQSVGRMKTSMGTMMTGCITNIILDPIMIFGFGPIPAMGIRGAALATGLAQTLTTVIYFVVNKIRPLPVHFGRKYLRPDGAVLKKVYSIGVPACLTIALPSLLVSALNHILASPVYITVLGIYYKLQSFVYLPANGIIQGIRPLVGYNYGAEEYDRVRKIYKTALMLTMTMMLLGTILCMGFPQLLVTPFTSNPETIEAGTKALSTIAIGFIISAVSFTSCGTLEGLGKGPASLVISLMRFAVVSIPLAWVLHHFFGAAGVWNEFWITEFLTAGVAYRLYKRALPDTLQTVHSAEDEDEDDEE